MFTAAGMTPRAITESISADLASPLISTCNRRRSRTGVFSRRIRSLTGAATRIFRQYKRRLLDEAMYGADFLVRMKSPGGSFYRTVDAPGPGKRPEDRRIGKEGVGFAIKTVKTKDNFSIGDTRHDSRRISL